MIGVIDYGVGNVSAIVNVYAALGINCSRIKVRDDFDGISRAILPGVGSFDFAMSMLRRSGLHEEIDRFVRSSSNKLLGICVGMQMLATSSDEGVEKGLDYIPGVVRYLGDRLCNSALPLPHMGWNVIKSVNFDALFSRFEIERDQEFYFLHSYFLEPKDPDVIKASAWYEVEIPALVSSGNIYGMQCHPEKSHRAGENFLRAFAEF